MNSALQFDGQQNFARRTSLSSPLGTAAISFGGWFNMQAGQPQPFPHLMSLGNFDNGCLYFNPALATIQTKYNNVGLNLYDFGADFTPWIGKTTHVASIYDGTKIRILINGAELTFQNASGAITWASDQCLVVGASDDADDGGYFGAFAKEIADDVFVYNSALTPIQLLQIINTGVFPAGNLVRWLMDEGTGTSLADASGNGNTGELKGSPLPQWVGGLSTRKQTIFGDEGMLLS